MDELLENHANYIKLFLQSETDFCSPVLTKEKSKRNREKIKVYIAIFICFVTKATHIKLVSDLATLRRFFARKRTLSNSNIVKLVN